MPLSGKCWLVMTVVVAAGIEGGNAAEAATVDVAVKGPFPLSSASVILSGDEA